MANIRWKENSLVNITVSPETHTLALLKRSPYAWFFDVRRKQAWDELDLPELKPLFCIGIVNAVLNKMATKPIDPKRISSSVNNFLSELAIPKPWIKPHQNTADWNVDNFPFRGGKLIELNPNIGSLDSPVLKENLDVTRDRIVVEHCELTTMWADQDLTDRLTRFFDKGINRDDLKFEIFPELWNDREKLRPLTRRLPLPLR